MTWYTYWQPVELFLKYLAPWLDTTLPEMITCSFSSESGQTESGM
jgi:hypothetical protein